MMDLSHIVIHEIAERDRVLLKRQKRFRLVTWETLRDGDYAAVLAVGPMVQVAEEAAEQLAKEGINLRVVNARFIKPLDEAYLLQLANESIPIITMEEGSIQGGFGSAVVEFYAAKGVRWITCSNHGDPGLLC